MARDGAGNYSLPSGNPVVTGTTISSTTHNTTNSDIASALTQSLSKDGQTAPTANLQMAGFKFTSVGDATARNQYASAGQVQDGALTYLTSISGADTITASSSPAITAYATGAMFWFISAGANTTSVTLNINSLGAKSVTKQGATALAAGEIPSSAIVVVAYDGTRFQLINVKKVTTLLSEVNITGATAETALATDDEFPIYDTSEGANNKITIANALKVINALTEDVTPDAAADYLITYDTSAAAAKKVLLGNQLADATTSVKGKVQRATQADMEAETSGAIAVTPDVLRYSPVTMKLWCQVNFPGGVATTEASHQVTTLVDNNPGDVTVVFTLTMSSTAYGRFGCVQRAATNSALMLVVKQGVALSNDRTNIACVNTAGTLEDSDRFWFGATGDI